MDNSTVSTVSIGFLRGANGAGLSQARSKVGLLIVKCSTYS